MSPGTGARPEGADGKERQSQVCDIGLKRSSPKFVLSASSTCKSYADAVCGTAFRTNETTWPEKSDNRREAGENEFSKAAKAYAIGAGEIELELSVSGFEMIMLKNSTHKNWNQS